MSNLRRAFTFIELLAVMLVMALGFGAVIGLVSYGVRLSGEAQAALSAMPTAISVLEDPEPLGRSADVGDADGDEWGSDAPLSGLLGRPSYTITVRGAVNGYWVKRIESSTAADRIGSAARSATVTVEVYWGPKGSYVTGLRRRIVRRGPNT